MKVGMITPGYPRYSNDFSGIFIKKLAETVSGLTEKLEVFVPADLDDSDIDEKCSSENLDVKRVRYAPGKMEILFYRPSGGFPQLLKQKSPSLFLLPFALFALSWSVFWNSRKLDILHCHWLPTLGFGFFPKIFWGKKLVASVRGSDLRLVENSRVFRFIVNIFLKKCDSIITVSESVSEAFKKSFPKFKGDVKCIPNGISFRDAEKEAKKREKWKLLFVGNIVKEKGIFELKTAFDSLLKEDYDLHLTLVGDENTPYKEEFLEWQKSHGDRVKITGMLTQDAVLNEMTQHDMLVFPSYSEGRPNVILEAMGCGLPVIASDIPGTSDILFDKKNGVLVNVKDSDSLKQGLKELLDNPEFLAQLAENGKNFLIESKLTWENCATKHHELYKSIFEKK